MNDCNKHKGMPSKWAWIIFNLVIYAAASFENDSAKAFIELIEFDYEDSCASTAEAEWTFINFPSNETLSTWEEKLIDYAIFKNVHRIEVANKSKNISDPPLKYKYDIAVTIGDALLNQSDFRKLVRFAGAAEFQRLSAVHRGVLKNHTRKDVERQLSLNNSIEEKKNVWTAWHQELAVLVKNISTILPLVEQAAKENGAKDVTEYWELLSGFPDGYNKIKYEWNKIADLHKKLLKHVMNNFSHKYHITMNETVPAYLLGSLQGSEWTPISVDASSEPDLMFDIKKNLWKRKLLGKTLYKRASDMGMQLLKHVPNSEFWDKSRFNQQCPSKLINFCKGGNLRVSTCYEPTVSNFVSAHKNVGKTLFNQMSANNIIVLNTANRYSVLEEAVSELFGILAASPAWLNHVRVIDNSTDNDQHQMVSLMITALDVLPRLTYYMAADMWRINAIQTGITDSKELTASWWQYRQEYQGIDDDGTEIPTFLNDDYITSNKPYLPKLTGTILAFQLYHYLMESTEVRYDLIEGKQTKADFIKMIHHGGSDDWSRVINTFLEIDEISPYSLVSFFSMLEDLIDTLDEDFEYRAATGKESELQELEKRIIEEVNAPTTTSTARTTVAKRKMTTAMPPNKQNDGKSDTNAVAGSDKSLDSKSSVHATEEKSANHKTLQSESSTKVPFNESLYNSIEEDDEQDNKPKINTSKAVWAVGAVLLATIVICVIAIFGRRRCRKTPKNRRYV
nr:angiotensin-converting enzyme-like isoform X1 [Nomia melanderi]